MAQLVQPLLDRSVRPDDTILARFQVKCAWANIGVKLMTAYWPVDMEGQEEAPTLLNQARVVRT